MLEPRGRPGGLVGMAGSACEELEDSEGCKLCWVNVSGVMMPTQPGCHG